VEIHDYNGEGEWSKDEIIRRYMQYCRELNIEPANLLSKTIFKQGEITWIYPVMDNVIAGIERGDAACRIIGVEFIEENRSFPFGRSLKSNTARALRRSNLTDEEKQRFRRRVVAMLIDGRVPREYKQYARLLKKIGVGNLWNEIESRVDRSNPYVMRWYKYLRD
jgi:hypothetical protein